MGFFCAHEYSENLEELLENELNVKQFNLFKEWKESEIKSSNTDCHVAHDVLAKKLDRIETILERITVRLEAMEVKSASPENAHISSNMDSMTNHMADVQNVLQKIVARLDSTEERVNKAIDRTSDFVEPIVNQIDGVEKILEKIVNRLELTEKHTNKVNDEMANNFKSLLEENKKTEVFQENLLTRMSVIEQCVQQTKQIHNPGNSGKSPHVSMVPTKQEKPEEPKKENQQSMKKKTLYSLPSVEIISNYSEGDVVVKKGEIYGLLKEAWKGSKLVNISTGKTIGCVPRNHCKQLYIPGTQQPKRSDSSNSDISGLFNMDPKTIFLNSLYDEQMGFFCAHEYSENLEELLKDELNVKQFNLFKEWRESEKTRITNDSNVAFDLLAKKLDRMEVMLERITVRLEALEEKPVNPEIANISSKVDLMTNQIAEIGNVFQKMMTRLDSTEEKVNKVNKEILDKLWAQKEENDTFQVLIVNRLKAIEDQLTQPEQVKSQQKQTAQRKPNVKKDSSLAKEVFKTVRVQGMEMLRNINTSDFSARKGETLGLLEYDELMNVKLGANGKVGWVPRNYCQLSGGSVYVEIPLEQLSEKNGKKVFRNSSSLMFSIKDQLTFVTLYVVSVIIRY